MSSKLFECIDNIFGVSVEKQITPLNPAYLDIFSLEAVGNKKCQNPDLFNPIANSFVFWKPISAPNKRLF